MTEIAGSTFLDFNSWSYTNQTDPALAFGYEHADPRPAQNDDGRIVIGLMLERKNDPADLLSLNWADRQKALAELNADGTLWSTYGADEDLYNKVRADLDHEGIPVLDSDGYISSAASRTIWIDVDAGQFKRVFGTDLMVVRPDSPDTMLFWNDTLSVPDAWNIPGTSRSAINALWLDNGDLPVIQNVLEGTPVTLPQGAQSPGNSVSDAAALTPREVAELYNFPLKDPSVVTGIAGVMEPTVGDTVPHDALYGFQEGFENYRTLIGIDNTITPFRYYVGDNGGMRYSGYGGERNMDVGILTAINPNATIGLYVGSDDLSRSFYPAFQSAIWDLERNPGVLSSSFFDYVSPAPNSPFHNAYHELYLDAALRNMTIFQASNDGGSSNGLPNGRTNVLHVETSEYVVVVGGTSLSIPAVAAQDTTLADIVTKAAGSDLATLRMLVATGLTSLPQDASALSSYIEVAWNQNVLRGAIFPNGSSYFNATSSNGGVDLTTPVPTYQQAYGLQPVDAATGGVGRGVPDVSAGAGGNITYYTPNTDFSTAPFGYPGYLGTSAAAPLWASLGLQIQTIFEDQGLPRPGYMNDLLYTAAVVAPASFNDITLGNNITSMNSGGPIYSEGTTIFPLPDGTQRLTPTGLGYEAGPGYDLVTGLGSPNGLLLARTLSAIAHAQMWFETPNVLSLDADSQWTGGASQALILQPSYAEESRSVVTIGDTSQVVSGGAANPYAWSDQFAQQTLQAQFSPDLVRLFDRQSHGMAQQASLAEGEVMKVVVGDAITSTPQVTLSNAYGFVDFDGGADSLRLARPLAVAETAGGADDQNVVVRLRQNGVNDLTVLFYKVDDFTGAIDGIAPGAAGYKEAVEARAYHTEAGDAWIRGAGYGEYRQTEITGVDAGDLIAMKLFNGTDTFYAFAEANEQVDGAHVGHLWNYGLNTWGWEDLYGGGDLDYNDLVVQLDFTSGSGSGWLV